jgi:hypothetical protein
MNFAFIGHPEYYHTAGDTVEHLDPVSLQEQGRYALSLTRWFGSRDIGHHYSGDAIYFTTPLTSLIVYSTWLGPDLLAAFVPIGLGMAAWVGRRRGARGLWMAELLAILGVLQVWVIREAPGASYLLAWPLVGGIVAFALLITAPPTLGLGWRVAVMALCAAPAFLVVVPLLPNLMVALTSSAATPVLAASAVLMAICLLPQLVLVLRREVTAETAR